MLKCEDLRVEVPLDHFGDTPGTIEVYARIVDSGAADGAGGGGAGGGEKPYLLYLQGGPGVEAFRPTENNPTWLPEALKTHRVVMLDQRGTGLSSPIGWVDGRFVGTGGAQEPEAVAERMSFYRADAIVEDAEAVRRALGVEKWAILGQSFGGFTSLRYLAEHPESLLSARITGGLARVPQPGADADPVITYARTWQIMREKSQKFFAQYPGAADAMKKLHARAVTDGIALPDGTVAAEAHVRSLGLLLGASGGDQKLRFLLEHDVDSAALRHDLQASLPFSARNPLYAAFHETCWASGAKTDWAALRARPAEAEDDSLWLSGEHVDPELFRTGPLAVWDDVAQALAERDWPVMWDVEKLRQADVPTAAAVYTHDAFVPREMSLETAALLPKCEVWETDAYEHNGLAASDGEVLRRLNGLLEGMNAAG